MEVSTFRPPGTSIPPALDVVISSSRRRLGPSCPWTSSAWRRSLVWLQALFLEYQGNSGRSPLFHSWPHVAAGAMTCAAVRALFKKVPRVYWLLFVTPGLSTLIIAKGTNTVRVRVVWRTPSVVRRGGATPPQLRSPAKGTQTGPHPFKQAVDKRNLLASEREPSVRLFSAHAL